MYPFANANNVTAPKVSDILNHYFTYVIAGVKFSFTTEPIKLGIVYNEYRQPENKKEE